MCEFIKTTAEKMSTSFKRKGKAKSLIIPGTKHSIQNNQLLVSTGIPSMDYVFGGGIAVGTVLLVEEDPGCAYSDIVLKYFLAEGITCHHESFVCSTHASTQKIVQELPCPITDDPVSRAPKPTEDSDMKIAWRYNELPQEKPQFTDQQKFGHYYDLNKMMDDKLITATKITHHQQDYAETERGVSHIAEPYQSLLTSITKTIMEGQFTSDSGKSDRNILRIVLHGLGSPLWGPVTPTLPLFLYALRSLMRSAFAVCLVTVPTHLYQSSSFVDSIEHLSDTVIHLDSFAGTHREKNPVLKEYHGFFNIVKLPQLNSLYSHTPETTDLAFKLKRKRFTVEKLHLPPDFSDNVSRDQREKPMCSTSSKLDF